ncbi:MAG: dicarboxylate/amino acid:cation symporter [Armatimonadota bacterium]
MQEVASESPKNRYQQIPLYIKIVVALVLGAVLGVFGKNLGVDATKLKWVSDLVLRMLRLLATPLIFSAILGSIITANVSRKKAGRLMWLLASNSVVAILVGLLVANILKPGEHLRMAADSALSPGGTLAAKEPYNIWNHLFESIPTNFFTPFVENNMISIIILAIVIGMAMRILFNSKDEQMVKNMNSFQNVFNAIFQIMITILKWVFELVPLAVFAVVAAVVAKEGLGSLLSMGYWVISVVLALALMLVFYVVRLSVSSKVSPVQFLKGGSDAFVMAFSTASSAATLPVTYRCATDKLNIKPENANLGIMVGGTFNHDGTALYEAMAALFIAQRLGMHLPIQQQVVVVGMSMIASVGAAGIPNAGLVTMIAVFMAVGLPIEFIPFLLTVDWFLDRCRTTINVMGDMASTCILDAKD